VSFALQPYTGIKYSRYRMLSSICAECAYTITWSNSTPQAASAAFTS